MLVCLHVLLQDDNFTCCLSSRLPGRTDYALHYRPAHDDMRMEGFMPGPDLFLSLAVTDTVQDLFHSSPGGGVRQPQLC